jgi:hypothetical protein
MGQIKDLERAALHTNRRLGGVQLGTGSFFPYLVAMEDV